ncbi:MAG: ABC transporter permease [Phycisphaeraceae bacterium]
MLALILRRLLWLVPTLLVISFVSFAVIQAPPGDFLTMHILALEESGQQVDRDQIERLREEFNLDDPFMIQYTKWLNDLLPFGFQPAEGDYLWIENDDGERVFNWPRLKTPDLGRSMELDRPVTALLAERLPLTIALSLCTLLFTWVVAIPIGIYSATRQYSVGDYLFTFLGFIGLAMPNFLLALVFMYVGQVYFDTTGGLFSLEYRNAPWSWGKLLDLAKHIWVPMIVIGTAGTAGMIRVMRGNLLDELGKQYVVTARAKGLKRWKLTLKYPVRVALNPLVSTVGWVLPAIISGEVIVGVVLGLPTVGPLLLQALMNQDMYLAGSIIMLMAVLTVLGTLLSDLLLLWLDPRIRYEGGSR